MNATSMAQKSEFGKSACVLPVGHSSCMLVPMPFTTRLHNDLCIVQCTGNMDLPQTGALLRQLWTRDGQFTNPYILLDARECVETFTAQEFDRIATTINTVASHQRYGRIAMLMTPARVDRALALIRRLVDPPFEMQAFSDEADAMDWLETPLG